MLPLRNAVVGFGDWFISLAGSEDQEDRVCFYREIAPFLQATRWYQELCSLPAPSNPTFLLEGLRIAGCLSERCLNLLREGNQDAYEMFSLLRDSSFKMDFANPIEGVLRV